MQKQRHQRQRKPNRGNMPFSKALFPIYDEIQYNKKRVVFLFNRAIENRFKDWIKVALFD